jgi:5-methylcytosine-specific restriction endonuclease McrA
MIFICGACGDLVYPGQEAKSTKGRHRRPVQMHADCWAAKRAGLKSANHLAMTEHYKATGAACVRCGSTENIQADHIVSRAAGGSSDPSNYQPMCGPCNNKKGG